MQCRSKRGMPPVVWSMLRQHGARKGLLIGATSYLPGPQRLILITYRSAHLPALGLYIVRPLNHQSKMEGVESARAGLELLVPFIKVRNHRFSWLKTASFSFSTTVREVSQPGIFLLRPGRSHGICREARQRALRGEPSVPLKTSQLS